LRQTSWYGTAHETNEAPLRVTTQDVRLNASVQEGSPHDPAKHDRRVVRTEPRPFDGIVRAGRAIATPTADARLVTSGSADTPKSSAIRSGATTGEYHRRCAGDTAGSAQ